MVTEFETRAEFISFLKTFPYKRFPVKKENEYITFDRRAMSPLIECSIYENIDLINTIYRNCKRLEFRQLVYTPSGSIKKQFINMYGAYHAEPIIISPKNKALKAVLIEITYEDILWRFEFGHLRAAKDSTATGTKAFAKFLKICKKLGIDLESYKCSKEEGLIYKDMIEAPMIVNHKKHILYDHVNHLDLHNAWPSCICEEYPELEPAYKALKDKQLLNSLNGYFQSSFCDFQYSKLAMTGINGCNAKIEALMRNLERNSFQILGVNTDGIWYKDTFNRIRTYHDKDEGEGMHKWANDHVDCQWYAFSDGQYYFIEEGKMNVKARGYYAYESVKPRDQWNAQDFMNAMNTLVRLEWNDRRGVVNYSTMGVQRWLESQQQS